jgi:polysaccharide pyruvyl transferase WcaK-like protein
MINAFHGLDVGNSGLLRSCQQTLTRLESSNFIPTTIKNYVLPHKIFLHDKKKSYYTVNMSFGTRTYFRLRYVTSKISVSPVPDLCTIRYALLGLYTERLKHKKSNVCTWMFGGKTLASALKKKIQLSSHSVT